MFHLRQLLSTPKASLRLKGEGAPAVKELLTIVVRPEQVERKVRGENRKEKVTVRGVYLATPTIPKAVRVGTLDVKHKKPKKGETKAPPPTVRIKPVKSFNKKDFTARQLSGVEKRQVFLLRGEIVKYLNDKHS